MSLCIWRFFTWLLAVLRSHLRTDSSFSLVMRRTCAIDVKGGGQQNG